MEAVSTYSPWREAWHAYVYDPLRVIYRNRRAFIGLLILLGFLLMATIGPEVVTLDTKARYADRFKPPSLAHPLGTDYVGRDVFAQIVHGSRDVLSVAFLAALFAVAIAIGVGMVSALLGGSADALLMLLTNVILTVPQFPVMLVFATIFRVKDPVSLALILSIWAWGGLARAIRSQVLSLREREFIEAARLLDLGLGHIITRELLPNVMSYVAINFLTIMRNAITASVGLMFLGLIPLSAENWGMMLRLATRESGAIYFPQGIYYVIAPMAAITLFQLGAVFFAHGLDEVFNPRLRE